jgi:hypothetical protein
MALAQAQGLTESGKVKWWDASDRCTRRAVSRGTAVWHYLSEDRMTVPVWDRRWEWQVVECTQPHV